MFKLIIHGGISPHGSDRTEGEQLRSIFQYGEAPLEPRYWNGAVALSPSAHRWRLSMPDRPTSDNTNSSR